ncbi:MULTISPECIES: hypothetical protein [Rahnella]|jgi:hypothetical protein|uniref:Uncharacterized protein n=1 Tax=Rahnella sp. (strain Y9602) TaxID=2703885 RepID=A0ABW6CFN9_RAHSY|nr:MULTISPECIES: hypothetical protein [unclassified Rahnella]MDP9703258.1 hypothetical protein [Rahnella aquatilis]
MSDALLNYACKTLEIEETRRLRTRPDDNFRSVRETVTYAVDIINRIFQTR